MEKVNLPHRFRESAYRRYEAELHALLNRYPEVITFDPAVKRLAPTTFACRFRDAMTSLAEHHWATTFNLALFLNHRSHIQVSETKTGLIVAGEHSRVRDYLAKGGENVSSVVGAAKAEPPFEFGGLPSSTLELLGELAHNRLLAKPVRFYGCGQPQADWLLTHFDVTATFDGQAVTVF